jgi:ubiquitin carboxyl-terminal hydrolase 9/24
LLLGWLVDLLNRFGAKGGFEKLSARFENTQGMTVTLVFAYIRPFGLCADFLTKHTVEKYFSPILSAVPLFLENLTDEELKKETARSDLISSIIRSLKSLQSRVSEADEHVKSLEIFRLRMILRMLKVFLHRIVDKRWGL